VMAQPDCVQACQSFRNQFPMCMPLYDDYLACLQTAPLVCGPNGSDPMAPECDGIVQKLQDCVGGQPPPPPPNFDAGGPGQCGGVVPPGPMSCAGGGSATGSSSGGQPMCFSSCTDQNHNTWESKCLGTTCSCTYNGHEYCTCTVPGPTCLGARGCCPGTP
jgi:hypothetical protein